MKSLLYYFTGLGPWNLFHIPTGWLLHRATSLGWAFAHVCDGAVIGEDCNLCDHTFFEKGVRLGNRVTIKCGVYLWEGAVLEDDVFVGPCVAFTNHRRPRSLVHPWLNCLFQDKNNFANSSP